MKAKSFLSISALLVSLTTVQGQSENTEFFEHLSKNQKSKVIPILPMSVPDPWNNNVINELSDLVSGPSRAPDEWKRDGSFFEIYKMILNDCEVAVIELTASQKKLLEGAGKILYKAGGAQLTTKHQIYLEYKGRHTETTQRYQEATSQEEKVLLFNQLKEITFEWEIEGYKAEVEKALATEESLRQLQPRSYVEALREKLDKFEKTVLRRFEWVRA